MSPKVPLILYHLLSYFLIFCSFFLFYHILVNMVSTRRPRTFIRARFMRSQPLKKKCINMMHHLYENKFIYGKCLEEVVRTLITLQNSPKIQQLRPGEADYFKELVEDMETNDFYTQQSEELIATMLDMFVALDTPP
uniref:Uncharacterized protein n=1 Tax=Tetranychus urticae TaxID=32264 RepID=T1KPD1_TETUR